MNTIAPPQSDGQLALAGARLTERYADETFAGDLNAARNAGDAQLRQAAKQLVSSALVMPVMQLMNESPFAEGPFAPGSAEKHFQPLLNQHLTEGIVGAANFPIVDVIVDRYTNMAAAGGAVNEEA